MHDECFLMLTWQKSATVCLIMVLSNSSWPLMHDARVLIISSLFTAVANNTILNAPVRRIHVRGVKSLLVADSAHRLMTWSMKPYPQARGITARQAAFNKSLNSARVAIEQTFGLLKGRWRCLLHNCNESVETFSYTIIACCICIISV